MGSEATPRLAFDWSFSMYSRKSEPASQSEGKEKKKGVVGGAPHYRVFVNLIQTTVTGLSLSGLIAVRRVLASMHEVTE